MKTMLHRKLESKARCNLQIKSKSEDSIINKNAGGIMMNGKTPSSGPKRITYSAK